MDKAPIIKSSKSRHIHKGDAKSYEIFAAEKTMFCNFDFQRT